MADEMLAKIQKLMALAERAGTKAEAELAFQKAQALMTKYAIDEAQLSLARIGKDVEIVSEIIDIGTDRSCQTLFSIVARNNHCAIIYLTSGYWDKSSRWRTKTDKLQIYGAKSDIEFTKMLYSSLYIFCEHSLMLMREIAPERYKGKSVAYNYRLGFATGVGAKMRMAVDTATREDSKPGTELVLVKRKDRADALLNAEHTDRRQRTAISVNRNDAYQKGLARGAQADVSGGRNNLEGSF